jgi:L-fuculose-phosphate aldolase
MEHIHGYQTEIMTLCEVGRRLYARGVVAANDGNLSCRVAAGFLITASGVSKGFLEDKHILLLDTAGELSQGGGRPSSEIALHLAIYAARPEVGAVLHAHPPYATAFALAGKIITDSGLDEVRMQLGEVPLIAYAAPGSAELARAVADGLGGASAALLSRHGAVTVGETLEQALYRLEALEQAAKIIWLAKQL